MMCNKELISVIVPIYNTEIYLTECIESILSQTYSNFELILINDGSTDKSELICIDFLSLDKRVSFFSQKNQGLTATRKKGWENSKGQWVIFVDSDDRLKENALEILYNSAIENSVDMVKASLITEPSEKLYCNKLIGKYNKEKYYQSLIAGNIYVYVTGAIFKKKIIKEDFFDIDSEFKLNEDLLMSYVVGSEINYGLNISDIVYIYRDNYNSLSKTILKHPSYLERFYRSLYKKIPENLSFYSEYLMTLDSNLIWLLIEAFFHPDLPYDNKYRKHLYGIIIENSFKSRVIKLLLRFNSLCLLVKMCLSLLKFFYVKITKHKSRTIYTEIIY